MYSSLGSSSESDGDGVDDGDGRNGVAYGCGHGVSGDVGGDGSVSLEKTKVLTIFFYCQ